MNEVKTIDSRPELDALQFMQEGAVIHKNIPGACSPSWWGTMERPHVAHDGTIYKLRRKHFIAVDTTGFDQTAAITEAGREAYNTYCKGERIHG